MKYMSNSGRRYTAEERTEYVLKILSGEMSVKEVSETTGISTVSLTDWKKQFLAKAKTVFEKPKVQKSANKDKLIKKQERQIGLLKKVLKHYKEHIKSPDFSSPDSS